MVEPITTIEELQNIIALELSLWCLSLYNDKSFRDCREYVNPKISKGVRGLVLKADEHAAIYLRRLGITDTETHHTVHMYGHSMKYLFTSKEDAEKWANSPSTKKNFKTVYY